MSEWGAKRFWTEASVTETENGFALLLDGKTVRSPGRRPLIMPSMDMAQAAAAEWAAQGKEIAPLTMPVTRSVNSALDQTAPQRAAVIDMLAAYGETDLICYRADAPEGLVARQVEAWDPLLDWAATALSAPLVRTSGIIPATQAPESLDALKGAVAGFGDFGLTALHDLIVLSGSVVVGLAVARGACTVQEAWRISRIDEDWQTEKWGEDDEASARADDKHGAFNHAARFLTLSGSA